MFGPPITAAMLAAGSPRAGHADRSEDPSSVDSSTDRQKLDLTHAEQTRLLRWARSGTVPQRVALRARIALLLATGRSPRTVARTLGVGVNTVTRWRKRVRLEGIEALTRDAPGRGRKRVTEPAWEPVLRDLMASAPPSGCRWTVRSLSATLGWSVTTTERRVQYLRRRCQDAVNGLASVGRPK